MYLCRSVRHVPLQGLKELELNFVFPTLNSTIYCIHKITYDLFSNLVPNWN